MELNIVIIANLINLVGVILLLTSHTFIGLSNVKKGFALSIFGGLFVATGSYLLGSYPIIILNAFWILISIYGYITHDKKPDNDKYKDKLIAIFLSITSILAVGLYFVYQNIDLLAYYTTFLYIFIYFMFASHYVKKESYLFWCLVGFFFVFPHLFEKMQYSVFLNEGYGAIISCIGLYKSYVKTKKQ